MDKKVKSVTQLGLDSLFKLPPRFTEDELDIFRHLKKARWEIVKIENAMESIGMEYEGLEQLTYELEHAIVALCGVEGEWFREDFHEYPEDMFIKANIGTHDIESISPEKREDGSFDKVIEYKNGEKLIFPCVTLDDIQ